MFLEKYSLFLIFFQVELCRSLIKELSAKFGLESEDKAMIEAGVLSRCGKTKEAVEVLLGPSGKTDDLEKVLIAAQVSQRHFY